MQNQVQHHVQHQSHSSRSLRFRDFFYHLAVFLFVLAILGLTAGVTSLAFMWVAILWGFTVATHAVYAYYG